MADRRNVLVVGQKPDPHIDAVDDALRKLGANVIYFDRNKDDRYALALERGVQSASLTSLSGTIALGEIHSVWWRVKPSAPVEFGAGTGRVEDAFRWREWKAALLSLAALTPTAVWVNPHPANFEAARKPQQLLLAQDLGFKIPDTVITNSAEKVLELFERHDRVIYKTLSSFLIPPNEIVYTNEVTRDEVRDSKQQILLAPGIFQEYVPKAYELRVTVVGNRLFPVKIDSQAARQTSVDWRRDQLREMYETTHVSPSTESRILHFMARSGICFGAFDFVVTPSGEEVFLECNPGGQWLWLEHRTGCAVTAAVAELLIST